MNTIALASGVGFLIGAILFLILAFTGKIDQWTINIEKWFASRKKQNVE